MSDVVEGSLLPGIRACATESGWLWVTSGFRMFMRQPGAWLLIGVVLAVLTVIAWTLPIFGQIAQVVLTICFVGGAFLACRTQDEGGAIEVSDLFSGFDRHTTPLLVLGALATAATIALTVVFVLVVGTGFFSSLAAAAASVEVLAGIVMGGLVSLLLGLLVVLALSVPIVMAFWFAPALVVLRNESVGGALRLSFDACMKNVGPFLIYGVVFLFLGLAAMFTLGLGFLVLGPLTLTSTYAAYVDIFGSPARRAV